MINLIATEPVSVIKRTQVFDDVGDVVDVVESVETIDCAVVPGATSDLDATRPNGVRVAYTLHFPKTYEGGLRACEVEVRGRRYSVVGDPRHYTDANAPGPFWMPVEVGDVDG